MMIESLVKAFQVFATWNVDLLTYSNFLKRVKFKICTLHMLEESLTPLHQSKLEFIY